MNRHRTVVWGALATVGLAVVACSGETVTRPTIGSRTLAPSLNVSEEAVTSEAGAALIAMMDDVNASLDAEGVDFRVAIAEYSAVVGGGDEGGTVLSKVVGNKQLTAGFVPFDTRRSWSAGGPTDTDNITFAIDASTNATGTRDAIPPAGGLNAEQTTNAILRAMATWENVNCSNLALTRNNSGAIDIGVVAFQNRLGGSAAVVADVQHAGWRDINFTGNILGVTFTFVFGSTVGGVFVPSDIDGNRLADVAFREIYYDPSFNWADNGVANIDVESVAVHEAGHGLSQAHFGKVWLKNNGDLKASPRAVMNALYAAPFRELTGTDNGGHCSNWASWPNR